MSAQGYNATCAVTGWPCMQTVMRGDTELQIASQLYDPTAQLLFEPEPAPGLACHENQNKTIDHDQSVNRNSLSKIGFPTPGNAAILAIILSKLLG